MSVSVDLYEMLDEILKQGKATGQKPTEMIEGLPADQEKKDKLRQLIQMLIGQKEVPEANWQY